MKFVFITFVVVCVVLKSTVADDLVRPVDGFTRELGGGKEVISSGLIAPNNVQNSKMACGYADDHKHCSGGCYLLGWRWFEYYTNDGKCCCM